jgi:hypothetical protein
MTLQLLRSEFLIYEENLIFFLSVHKLKVEVLGKFYNLQIVPKRLDGMWLKVTFAQDYICS